MALTPGSIAFVGFNADGSDGFAFLAVDAIDAGTIISFRDDGWNGTAFTTGEATFTWTATAAVAPGSLVEVGSIASGAPTANVGTAAYVSGGRGFSADNEVVYAYTGTAASPNFVAAAANNGFTTDGSLTGTGLVAGTTAVDIGGQRDIGAYNAPVAGTNFGTDRVTALNTINNGANWLTENGTGDQSINGGVVDAPFLTDPQSPLANAAFTICYYPGTLIATPDGQRAVETLRAGDLVLTAGGGAVPVLWMGRQTVSTRFQDPLRVLPIRLRAGSLAEGLPRRDLRLSPDHAILLDGVLVNAAALVNGTSILRDSQVPEIFTYWHIETRDHALVLAEGAAAETFVDNVTRRHFDNFAEYEALFGAERTMEEELPQPRAMSQRQVPPAIRARIAARAVALAGDSAAAA